MCECCLVGCCRLAGAVHRASCRTFVCFQCTRGSPCLQVDETLLKATELRLAGNAAARSGDLKRACTLYTVGLELDPPGGRHLLLSNRRCA